MKRKTLLNMVVCTALFLFLPGCLDIYITTQLFPNGEIEKTVVIKGDSSNLRNAPFHFMADTGWTEKYIPTEDDQMSLVMTKKFKSYKELNRIMDPADTTIQVIRVKSDLKRKFRWFFTYLDYSETIRRADPFKTLRWQDYLTQKEIRLIKLQDEDSLKKDPDYQEEEFKIIEKKYEQFILKSAFESFNLTLMGILNAEPDLAQVRDELTTRKEEFYRFLIDSSNTNQGPALLEATDRFLGTEKLAKLSGKYEQELQLFNARMEFWDQIGANGYKFIIRMPGILLNTNSNQVQGLESRWEFNGNELYFEDVVLKCESRILNKWAFVVAGLVILLALGLLVAKLWPRANRS